jgi:hypothetical protein
VKQQYTGERMEKVVTHILYGGEFGIPDDYCVMSLSRE